MTVFRPFIICLQHLFIPEVFPNIFQPRNSAVVPMARRTPRARTLPDAILPSCPSWPRPTSAGCPKREARRETLQLDGSSTWNTEDVQSKLKIIVKLVTCSQWFQIGNVCLILRICQLRYVKNKFV
jgi:hypothetical protein